MGKQSLNWTLVCISTISILFSDANILVMFSSLSSIKPAGTQCDRIFSTSCRPIYRTIPVISPGHIQLRKGFMGSKQKNLYCDSKPLF